MTLSDSRITELKGRLDPLVRRFERTEFIVDDPISVPHGFDDPADQEVIGLLAALLAWGRRATMLAKLEDLCNRMSWRPAAFMRDFDARSDASILEGFVHRTFNAADAVGLCVGLQNILAHSGSLESLFQSGLQQSGTVDGALEHFSGAILEAIPGRPRRMNRHVARPSTGSACKRLVMYLRWMTRPGPVDLGIWTSLSPARLPLPLDVHSGRQARAIGMLHRKANDWKAVQELTAACRLLCPEDPAKYDFAFFGTGSVGEQLEPFS